MYRYIMYRYMAGLTTPNVDSPAPRATGAAPRSDAGLAREGTERR